MEKNNNSSKRKVFSLGIIIFIIGISLLSYDFWMTKKSYAFEYMNNKLYLSSREVPEYIGTNDDIEDNSSLNNEVVPVEKENNIVSKGKTINSYYKGYLEIPKINFKKGFVDINSQDNRIDRNITIISGSSMPDVDKGNLIIAGHSGSGSIAYFKNLYKLTKKDYVYIYYNNKKYSYQIVNIYKQVKNGSIAIYRNYDKTTLTLVTCTKDDHNSQTVYIAELINKESY